MDKTLLMLLLMLSLLGCSSSKPAKKRNSCIDCTTKNPNILFTLDGNLLQIRLLTEESMTTKPTEVYQEDKTNFAVVHFIPKTPAPIRYEDKSKSLQTFYKMKDLFKQLAHLMESHEEEMLLLMKHEEEVHGPQIAPLTEKVVEQQLNDDINIHVHADPELRMRTLVGSPQNSKRVKIGPLQNQQAAKIRIYPRDFLSSNVNSNESPGNEQEIPLNEESFIRRGSEFLLSMWKRFQSRRQQPYEQEQPDFNEELVNAEYF